MSDSPAKMSSRPTFDDRVSLWLSKLARFNRVHLRPKTTENYDTFYDDFFAPKDQSAGTCDHRKLIRQETVQAYLKKHITAGANILDVGCGLGELLVSLPQGYTLAGTDYSQANVQVATRLLDGKARIVQGDIYNLPFDATSQDVCLCLEVLEHIEDDARAVREISRILKPGGILIAAVPYNFYWPEYKQLIGHFRHYTRESFSNLMDVNGLKTESYLVNYPHWHRSYARRYCVVRVQALLFGWLWGRRSVYSFKWPWSQKTGLQRLAEKLDPVRQSDALLDYAQQESSTFLVARKPANGAHL